MNNNYQNINLPLLDFFFVLQKRYGKTMLDGKNYMLLIEALQQGIGIDNKENLRFLCKTLWLKPDWITESEFDELFDTHLEKIRAAWLKKKIEETPKKNIERLEGDDLGEENSDNHSEIEATEDESDEKTKNEIDEMEEPEEPKLKGTKSKGLKEITIAFEVQKGMTERGYTSTQQVEEVNLEELLAKKRFITKGEYFPISPMEMRNTWQLLRKNARRGRKSEIDIDATILKVAQTGFFEDFEFRATFKNQSQLTIIIDTSPAMIAFNGLAKQLVGASQEDNTLESVQTLYFTTVPKQYLYKDEFLNEKYDINALAQLPVQSIVIISDAGVANHSYDEERIEQTQEFLKNINKHQIAWLNPFPRERWYGTSASFIARSVPMFELNQAEFRTAVKYLKGVLRIGGR